MDETAAHETSKAAALLACRPVVCKPFLLLMPLQWRHVCDANPITRVAELAAGRVLLSSALFRCGRTSITGGSD
jgi:hypothetical protein